MAFSEVVPIDFVRFGHIKGLPVCPERLVDLGQKLPYLSQAFQLYF